MKKNDLQDLEAIIMTEVVRRRQLGGYSMEAEGILTLCEATLRVVQHLIENYDTSKQQEANPVQPANRKRSRAGGGVVK